LGIIRIEEVSPVAQTRGRFDSEALLALKPQAWRNFSVEWPPDMPLLSLSTTSGCINGWPSIQGPDSFRSDVPD